MLKAPAPAILFIIGLAMIPVALQVNPPMVGVAALCLIAGAAGLVKNRKSGGE